MRKSLLKNGLFLFIISALAYADLAFWRLGWLGLALLAFYLIVGQNFASHIFIKFFNFSKSLRTKFLAAFFVLAALGSELGALMIFYRLTPAAIGAAILTNGLFFLFLGAWAERRKHGLEQEAYSGEEVLYQNAAPGFLSVAYLILVGVGFYFLAMSRTGAALSSPWQTIEQNYIYVFFAATLILGLLIFSKLTVKTLLFLLMLHTFLLHAYLPMTHELVYGADQWRHFGTELAAAREQPLALDVYNEDGGLVSGAFNPSGFSYSQQWGLEVFFSRIFNAPLVKVNAWFMPIIWSLVFPLLLFELAGFLGHNKRRSLFFVWLGFLPFAWQVAGSFSLPNNFGFLFSLFLLLLLLRRLNSRRWEQAVILAAAGLLSVFGYALYLVLFVAAWVLVEVFRFWRKNPSLYPSPNRGGAWGGVLVFLASVVVIPLAEIITGFARLAPMDWLAQCKQIIGNFSAYFLATGPRPHDILGGNVIFNQVPSYAFVANFFTSWLFWLPVFMAAFIAVALAGAMIIRRRGFEYKWLGAFLSGLFVGYLAVFYFFSGEKIFTRRLDNVLALFFMVFVFAGMCWLFDKFKGAAFKIVVVAIFSVAITASYSLGPDTNAVSADEYKAMQYVWSQEKDKSAHCVLADTMPLLALEAISAKEIIGGGFPINKYFAQPERVELLKETKENLNANVIKQSFLELTDADGCWVAGEFYLSDAKKFGRVYVKKFFK